MILSVAWLTLRECFRRSFPYVAVAGVGLLALCSHLFSAFSFGAGEAEAANLAVSAVFLAGLLHAAFQATTTVRADFDRGTLGLLFSQPVTPTTYLAGRFTGLAASGALICGAVALLMVGVFALPLDRSGQPALFPHVLLGFARVLPPLLVLEAAALAISSIVPRILGPFALLAFFLAGSLADGPILRFLLPDFGVFALEAGPGVNPFASFGYATAHALFYLGLAHVALSGRAPIRSQT